MGTCTTIKAQNISNLNITPAIILLYRVEMGENSPLSDFKSKEEGKDQKSIQSSTTPDPEHHMGK